MGKKSQNRFLTKNSPPRAAGGWLAIGGMCLLLVVDTGCQRGPRTAPVTGTVKLDGQPLQFGTVTFQPPSGQSARGDIQADGSFQLSTLTPGDGAYVGPHKVRITCYQSQAPSAAAPTGGEVSLGKLLIPRRYTFFDQSGLTAVVEDQDENHFDFELSSKK